MDGCLRMRLRGYASACRVDAHGNSIAVDDVVDVKVLRYVSW